MVVTSIFDESDIAVAYRIFEQGRINPWSKVTFRESALNGISLVAKENNNILGYVILSSVLDELTIEDITVDAAHRKNGIGRQLMDACLALATKMQQTTVYLEVRYNNQPALSLYREFGFEIVGERKNYYDTVPHEKQSTHANTNTNISPEKDNAYVMQKVL